MLSVGGRRRRERRGSGVGTGPYHAVMGWSLFRRKRMLDAGRLARLLHSRWLTEAIARPMDVPRIPTRRVSDGGFGPMLARPGGRARADRWWDLALERLPEE